MATLFVYNNNTDLFDVRPYSPSGTDGDICWTDIRFINACKELCSKFELRLARSFVPIFPGKCSFSPHHAGLGGDFVPLCPCKNLAVRLNEIRRWCIKSGCFSYVQPQYISPLWVHGEISTAPSSSLFVPYPVLFPGNTGVHTFILQKCLSIIGYPCLLCGRFGVDTASALARFRLDQGLPPSDAVDADCWQRLIISTANAPRI